MFQSLKYLEILGFPTKCSNLQTFSKPSHLETTAHSLWPHTNGSGMVGGADSQVSGVSGAVAIEGKESDMA